MSINLHDTLYKIKNDGEISYLKLLGKDTRVQEIVKNVCLKNKCKRKVVEELLQDYTIRYYKFDEMYTEERYLNLIKKYLGRRVREIVSEGGQNERSRRKKYER